MYQMSLTKTFLPLIVVLFCLITSCEDKQSQKNKDTTTEMKTIEKDSTVADSTPKTIATKKDTTTIKQEEDFKITNDNLVDFFTKYGKENPETLVRIKTRLGNFDIQLFKETPIHRANFIYLVKEKYFDETFFYRVSKGFVIQGGNSDRQEMAKKRFEIGDYSIPQEQIEGLRHDRGMVALSKQWVDNPSNRSTPYEFFVVVSKNGAYHLDGEHTIFGKVVRGMDTVDKISNVPVDGSEWPKENIFITAEVIR